MKWTPGRDSNPRQPALQAGTYALSATWCEVVGRPGFEPGPHGVRTRHAIPLTPAAIEVVGNLGIEPRTSRPPGERAASAPVPVAGRRGVDPRAPRFGISAARRRAPCEVVREAGFEPASSPLRRGPSGQTDLLSGSGGDAGIRTRMARCAKPAGSHYAHIPVKWLRVLDSNQDLSRLRTWWTTDCRTRIESGASDGDRTRQRLLGREEDHHWSCARLKWGQVQESNLPVCRTKGESSRTTWREGLDPPGLSPGARLPAGAGPRSGGSEGSRTLVFRETTGHRDRWTTEP